MSAKKLHIAILGTRGIPNAHGGFEQCAEFLAVALVERGYDITVYNSHLHPYQENNYKGVRIIHCRDWEDRLGTAGQFLYDLNCIRHAQKENYDVIIQLGYTSSAIWWRSWPKNVPHIVNMDGLEWKRTKYSKHVQNFLKRSETWAVRGAQYLVADNEGMSRYLHKLYYKPIMTIAYGAEKYAEAQKHFLEKHDVEKNNYLILIARMEPENNIEMILDGYVQSASDKKFVVIGKMTTPFGKYLLEKFSQQKQIIFLGAIYNQEEIHALRHFSYLYFHGHSVGGTNPSLLEAMASQCLIASYHVFFNESILQENAFYFSKAEEVASIINSNELEMYRKQFIENNFTNIEHNYTWAHITDQYEKLILQAVEEWKLFLRHKREEEN